METFYPKDAVCVKPQIFGIPLEVAQDAALSDGAVLLFGEIYGLIRAHNNCFALDQHFQDRRGKSRSTIQAQLKELRERGYIYVLGGKNARREIRIPQRFLGGKDVVQDCPENKTPDDDRCPGNRTVNEGGAENRTAGKSQCPGNETPSADTPPENALAAEECPEDRTGGCPENKTHKTPESFEEESKNTASESPSLYFTNSISSKDQAIAKEAFDLFADHPQNGSLREYEGLLARCQGRQECFEIGVLSARQRHDAKKLGAPIALIRSVMDKNLVKDKGVAQAVLDDLRHNYETPAQRREIDERERRLAAEKAANSAPLTQEVDALLNGATKPMPSEGVTEVQARINALNPYDQDQIKHIACKLSLLANAEVARRDYADRERKALVCSLMPQALEQWEAEQAEKRPLKSREDFKAFRNAAKRAVTSPP